jgi:hypothetical protein
MFARRPTAAGEPAQECPGKEGGRVRRSLDVHDSRPIRALSGCKPPGHKALPPAVAPRPMCIIVFSLHR